MKTLSRTQRFLPYLILALAVALGACSESTAPETEISEEARVEAMTLTADALQTDALLESARAVEVLTGGFAEGLGDDTAGLETELGDEFQGLDNQTAEYASVGRRLISAKRSLASVNRHYRDYDIAASKQEHAPGDLLFRYEETNFDGSISVISVYQDEPDAVVLIELITTWPEQHWLLNQASETVILDRGADYADDSDDIWLSYAGEVEFANGAAVNRSIDRRAQGGIRDEDRVEVVSIFTPRPNHPRLLSIRTSLVVDVHNLDDESDDRFVSAERVSSFSGIAHDGGSPRVEESLIPSAPLAEGEEPCGGELSRSIYFRQDRRLSQWIDSASWSCDGNGQLSRAIDYADGTSASLSLSQSNGGPVMLVALERDGTRTDGSFDEIAGSFEFTTIYPTGSDPVSRDVAGQSLNEGAAWSLDETVRYADGFNEINHLEGSEDASGKTLSGSHQGRDESILFDLAANADETVLEGHIENDRDQVLDFRVEEFDDGGRMLDFTAVDAAVTVVGHLEVDAEGCGEGTLVVTEDQNTVTIEVSFCDETLVDESGDLSFDL